MLKEEFWYGSDIDEDAKQRAADSLAARVGRILGAKPFPASALRLARLTKNPHCNIDDLQTVLETDPALSARLLRLVNSAGFALRTECTSVRHAAALVGNSRLNQLATTAAIIDMYDSSAKHAAKVLEHATVVGALSRYLAYYFALPADDVFTCGFLHDIGKLMLLDTDGAAYETLLEEAGQQPDCLHHLELETFGFDHAQLAGHVLSNWSIPEPVPQVVAWHHNAAHAFTVSSEMGQIVSALRLADHMSYSFRSYHPEEEIAKLAKTDAAAYLDVSEAQLSAMWDEMAALAMRTARASRDGAGLPDTFSARPSADNLRAVRQDRKNRQTLDKPRGTVQSGRPGDVSINATRSGSGATVTSASGEIPAIVGRAGASEASRSASSSTDPELLPSNVIILDKHNAANVNARKLDLSADAERLSPHFREMPTLPMPREPTGVAESADEGGPQADGAEASAATVAAPEEFDSGPPEKATIPPSAGRQLAHPAPPAERSPELRRAGHDEPCVAQPGETAARQELPRHELGDDPARPTVEPDAIDGSLQSLNSAPPRDLSGNRYELPADATDSADESADDEHTAHDASPHDTSLDDVSLRESVDEALQDGVGASVAPTRLQPSPPQSIRPDMAADSPRQFVCVVCSGPTYAAQCPACHSYVCPEHQHSPTNWCSLCTREFKRYRLRTLPQWATLAVGLSYGGLVATFGFVSSGPPIARIGTTLTLAAALATILYVARQGLRRKRFLRSRPRRNTPEATGRHPGVSTSSPVSAGGDGATRYSVSTQVIQDAHDQAELALSRIEPSYDRASIDRLLIGAAAEVGHALAPGHLTFADTSTQGALSVEGPSSTPPAPIDEDTTGPPVGVDPVGADSASDVKSDDTEPPEELDAAPSPSPETTTVSVPVRSWTSENPAASLRPSARPSAMNLARRKRHEQKRIARALRTKAKPTKADGIPN